MQKDILALIKRDSKLLADCNQNLCEALWHAAAHNKFEHNGPLAKMYRSFKWHEYSSASLEKPRAELLQAAIKSHYPSLTHLLISCDQTLLRQCSTPPLCALLEKGVPVPMDIVDTLLRPCCELRPDGADEELHQKCALAHAMSAGQQDLVEKLIPWSRVDHRFPVKGSSNNPKFATRPTPLLYAVELKQHSWVVALVHQAKKQFRLEAEKRIESCHAPHDAAATARLQKQLADAARRKLLDWLDTVVGAGNPPAALTRAMELELWETAAFLVAEHADPFKTSGRGPQESTALHKAAELGKVDIVRAITKQIANGLHHVKDLETICADQTPLLLSITTRHFDVAELLLKAGANPWFACLQADSSRMSAAQAVVHVTAAGDRAAEQSGFKVLQQILSKPPPRIDSGNEHIQDLHLAGTGMMHEAISRSLLTMAVLLMRQGVDITDCHTSGTTVSSPLLLLIKAAEEGASAAADMLREALVIWEAPQTSRAAHCAMHDADQHKIVEWIVKHKESTVLPFAKTRKDQTELVQQSINAKTLILLQGLVKNLKLNCKGCYLHAVVDGAPLPLLVSLLKASDSVNQRHPESKTYILHKAVEANRGDVVEHLVQSKAQLKARDSQGNTALHLAVRCKDQETQEQIVGALLKKDATLLKELNTKGKTPADLISHKKKLREWFQAFSNSVIMQSRDGDSQPSDQSDSESDHKIEDEAVKGEGIMLTRPNESMPTQQRRIETLLQQISSNLEGAAVAEAAAAAAKKASQVEQPTAAKEERNSVWTALQPMLPSELPAKDELAPDHVNAAAADGDQQLLDEDDLIKNLVGLPWEFIINKAARQEWAGMDRQFRVLVAKRLQRIGEGYWGRDGGTERRLADIRGLEVYRTVLTKGGRIVFEVAVDYSQISHTWKELIRLWVVTLDHDRYERELNNIAESHGKSIQARDNIKLKAVGAGGGDLHARVPKIYQAIEQNNEDYEAALKALADANTEVREHSPAASASQDTYTLLKFYNLSTDLVKAVLRNYGEDTDIDFPFRVSPSEQKVIESEPDPPSSIVLVGRSGTGKTTCAVFRMWFRWLAFRHHSAEPFHQIFLTANPKLRSEVAKQFHKLRAAVVHDPKESKRLEDLSNQDYPSLAQIPSDAFPLFWTTKQYLRAIDATLPIPFFPRLEGGGLMHQEHAHNEDMGGIESLIDMDAGFSDDDSDDEDSEDAGDIVNDVQDGPAQKETKPKKGALGPKLEADYDFFVDVIWKAITTTAERQSMTPALVYQEICSFLKGCAEAMDCEGGKLSLEQYLAVGHKRAPNFSADTRQLVYPIFQRYERKKASLNRYDHMDLLFHIYYSLNAHGYTGTIIHNIYRDEVQDFTQAELLTDLRTMADPNGLFCCGDPCQTIARGIVFRFADVCTLFHDESQRRKMAGGQAAAMQVGLPKEPWHLPTNYRTHSGILGAAAAVVDLLRDQFSQHVDKLPREKAFFKGPPPLLLSSTNPEDLTFLLLGSDPKTSQVEFGAHQVILGRSKESLEGLPQHLRDSNVIKMTVAQSKGLEFDDVFLWDFFNGSPANWRPLNNFTAKLEEIEKAHGANKLPAGTPLVHVTVAAAEKGYLRLARSEDWDVLLCEEYKHLYTAITRAKNNVIVFDSNEAKRAPFFHYLRRLGLAQHTSKSVLEEHSDDSRYVLTQGKNAPEDWIQRGNNFMDCRLFDLAAHCYKVAKDSVRFTVANAYATALDVKRNRKGRFTTQQRLFCFKVGHDLVAAASWADQAPVPVPVALRKKWLAIAASMLSTSKDSSPLAASLYITLGDFKSAVTASLRSGDLVSAAKHCETLAGQFPVEADHWLQEAIKHYRKAKQPVESFDLLLRHPQLQTTLSGQRLDELAGIAMTAYHQKGEHSKALIACHKIRDAASQRQQLAILGYWEELARITEDHSKAAEILASHGHLETAIKRLMGSYQTAIFEKRKLELSPTDQTVLRQLHTYCANLGTRWAQEQVAIVVDAFAVEDPFFGHGLMAKGRLLEADGKPADATLQFKMALQAYRSRQAHSAVDCLVATAAILEVVSDEELAAAWSTPPRKQIDKQKDKLTCTNEYISYVLEAGQAAQDMLSALTCKSADRHVPRNQASLLKVENHYELKGLTGPQKDLSYSVHSAAFKLARGLHTDTQAIKQATADSTISRTAAEQAIASHLARLACPALCRACRTVLQRLSMSAQDQSKQQELTIDVQQIVKGLDIFAVAAKLLDFEAEVSRTAKHLQADLSQVNPMTASERDAMQAAIGAGMVQLQLPLACVDGIAGGVFVQFRKLAAQARMRLDVSGMSSLYKSWNELLHRHLVCEQGQNQNAGFAAWILASVMLGNLNTFCPALARLSLRQSKAKNMLKFDRATKLDCELLSSASQAFARGSREYACQALLFYLERCSALAGQPEQQRALQLAVEAHVYLIEAVGSLALLGLGRLIFLPAQYVDMLEHSPLLGSSDRSRVIRLRTQWQDRVKLEGTLTILTRVVRLLHHLVNTSIADAAALAAGPQLTSAVDIFTGEISQEEARSNQQRAAARIIVLAITLLTACDVHNSGPKVVKVPTDLVTAAWRVVHQAQAFISDADFLQHLKGYAAATTIGDALKQQLSLNYRLNTGLTQVGSSRFVAFDRLPKQPAPGLETTDSDIVQLLQLAKMTTMARPRDTAAKLSGSVRQLLLMPDASEVGKFSVGTGTGARKASAALVIQEAYRQHRHRMLCKAKLRYLRTSRLWRQAVRKWRHSVQTTLANRKEAAAVAAMEAQRKQYEADAQRRLAWVDQALQQQSLVDNTCPVCRKNAEKLYTAAQRRLANGGQSDEEEEEDQQAVASNPFAALSGLGNAVNAPVFVPHRHKEYHIESLTAYRAYKRYYTEQVVPVMTEQKAVEAALTEAEPRGASDAEFQNTLNEERFKLDRSEQQLQSCMKHLEDTHAWQDHLTELPGLLTLHSSHVQSVKAWLEREEGAAAEVQDIHTPRTPRQASGSVSWGTPKKEASWHSPEKDEVPEFDMYDEEDPFDDTEFELVQSKKQKKAAKRAKGKGK